MRVLVVYGSKRGGTEGLARAIGEALEDAGHRTDVLSAEIPEDLDPWDAVVVGGALYAGRWYRRARRFVQRHVEELSRMPVWMFSSGPLDDSATREDIPPTQQVRRLMDRVHARGHVTFGGRLLADTRGFIARAMVRNGHGGDFRDMDHARAAARDIARALDGLGHVPERPPSRRLDTRSRTLRRFAGVLCLFAGLSTAVGGLELMIWPMGPRWAPWLDPSILARTPFDDFFGPGLILFFLPGLVNLAAAVLLLRQSRLGDAYAVAGGLILAGWLAGELVLVGAYPTSQLVYLVVAAMTIYLALRHRGRRLAALHRRPLAA